MSKIKEPHFWTSPKKYGDFESYSELFADGQDKLYRGESSTGYMLFPNFLERLLDKVHDPKFIFILRNPIDRAYSHYRWLRALGSENLSFKEAMKADWDLVPSHSTVLKEGNYKSYYQFSLYGKWLEKFYSKMGFDKIHIITMEMLRQEPTKTLDSCFDFLNLPPIEIINTVHSNRTEQLRFPSFYKNFRIFQKKLSKPKKTIEKALNIKLNLGLNHKLRQVLKSKNKIKDLDHETRTWLARYLMDDVRRLKNLTGENFSEWIDFQD